MIDFMMATLGSVVFWIGYFIVSIFISTALLKHLCPNTFEYITTGKKRWSHEGGIYVSIAAIFFFFYPLILTGVIVCFALRFVFKTIFWNLFTRAIKFADSNTPEITFKKKED